MGIFILLYGWNLAIPEEYQIMDFYKQYYLNDCSLYEMPDLRAPLKLYLMCASALVFDNTRIIPFTFTMGLFPLLFIMANNITRSYGIALGSCALLLSSKIVGLLGTTGSFSSDWAFFFMLSCIMMYKKPILSGPFLLASMAAKGLPMLIIPIMIYWNYRDGMITGKKTNMISIGVVTGLVVALWLSGNAQFLQPDGFAFNPEEADLYSLYYVFRNDIAVFCLMVISFIGMILFRSRITDTLLISSLWLYGLVFLLPIFTIYEMYDYRMIPLVLFLCISAGITVHNVFKRLYPRLVKVPETLASYKS